MLFHVNHLHRLNLMGLLGQWALADRIRNRWSVSGPLGSDMVAIGHEPEPAKSTDPVLEGKLVANMQEKIHPNGHTLLMTFGYIFRPLAQSPGLIVAMTFLAESIHF